MSVRPNQPDCYDYVRRYYGVPAYIGVRVIAGGKPGVIVAAKSDLHYVHIWIDGDKHSNPHHPTYEIQYLVEAGDTAGKLPQAQTLKTPTPTKPL